jgi:hypothetical protein
MERLDFYRQKHGRAASGNGMIVHMVVADEERIYPCLLCNDPKPP